MDNKYLEWAETLQRVRMEMGTWPIIYNTPQEQQEIEAHGRVREMIWNAVIGLQQLGEMHYQAAIAKSIAMLGGLTDAEITLIQQKRKEAKS